MIARLTILLLSISWTCQAANHYVLAAAGGAGNGNDWANAFTALPASASLVRGDTYFIGVGSYAAFSLSKADNGSSIVIQRATIANHGTATGWNNAFDGQVHWAAGGLITTGNWDFEGIDGAWTTAGFYFDLPSNCAATDDRVQIGNGVQTISGITFSRCYFPFCANDQEKIALNCGSQTTASNFTNRFLYFDGAQNGWLWFGVSNAVADHCYWTNAFSSASHHGECVNFQPASTSRPCQNGIIGNCWFWSSQGTGCIIANDTGADSMSVIGLNIFGCVFMSGSGGNGVISDTDKGAFANANIFNNTFVSNSAVWIAAAQPSSSAAVKNSMTNIVITNNIVCGQSAAITDNTTSHVQHDYGYYVNCTSIPSEANGTTTSSNPFTGLTTGDFRLASQTTQGAIASLYSPDPNGTPRSFPSRGAFEFIAPITSAGLTLGSGTMQINGTASSSNQ